MPHRDRHFRAKVLIGLTFALLVVDVLALTFAVAPLVASQQKRAETPAFSARLPQSAIKQALILPTHDPRKPWVTRTPLPTATPWLTPAATPRSAGNATPILVDAPRASTAPESDVGIASAAPPPLLTAINPVGTPRPTLSSSQEVGPAGTISPIPSLSVDIRSASSPSVPQASSAEIVPSATPTQEGILPTATLNVPTSTPSPIPSRDTDQPPPRIVPGDEAQFEAYVRAQYNTIAGQPIGVVSVALDTTNLGIPGFVVRTAGDGTNNVFAAQTAAATLDYGRRLLNDKKFYFSGQNCTIAVVNTYETSDGDACTNNPTWCDLDSFDASANIWTVTWTYVWGSFTEGSYTIEAWNAGQ